MEKLIFLGIILNAVGLVILFIYNDSPSVKNTYSTILYQKSEEEKLNRNLEKEVKIFKKKQTIGFVFSILGLAFQALGLFL